MDSYTDKLTKLNQEAHASIMQQIIENMCPVLSMPYLHLQDAIDCAPNRAIVLLDAVNGTYQWMAIGDEHRTCKHVRALVNGVQQVTDLVCVAWNMDDGWDYWTN